MTHFITTLAEAICGYPLFFLLIGGGMYLFLSSGMVSLRKLPYAIRELRKRHVGSDGAINAQISSGQALLSAIAATIGLGNIAGVAIALVMGGPGAIFWMWVSALVGMATKFHEGTLTIMYRGQDDQGVQRGGTMYIIDRALGRRWRPLAVAFAVAGMFGTLCIMNANQLTEAVASALPTPRSEGLLGSAGAIAGMSAAATLRLVIGLGIAAVTAAVILGGLRRIAHVASLMVPVMVGVYFLMVLYIILTRLGDVPAVVASIFAEAFNLRAGFGALMGIALIGARRAALVNDAGVGTATIMHGASRNDKPVREGLVAMLGPSIDSGFVCTLTALAILLCADPSAAQHLQGMEVAMSAFSLGIPGGEYLLLLVVVCFGLSSTFSYSYYGTSCASYLFGSRRARWYVYAFIASLVVFAVIPIEAAVGMCDMFYALMAFPTMITLIALSGKVRKALKEYFQKEDDARALHESQLKTHHKPFFTLFR